MKKEVILSEAEYTAMRSSGAGGQHVNKVASKILLSFHVLTSNGLTEDEKALLEKNLASRLTKEGVLQVSCEESRSQFRNKALANERLIQLLKENLVRPTRRKPTKPTRGSVLRNAKNKRHQSEKKAGRKKPKLD